MKNSIIILASILTLAIIISVGMNFSITTKTTNLSMKNIEALADGESSLTGYQNAKRIYCVYLLAKQDVYHNLEDDAVKTYSVHIENIRCPLKGTL